MASPNHTPFIPPLGTPSAGPTPEIHTVPPPDMNAPPWAREQQQQQHRTPAHYPAFPPFSTPFTNPPIIPPGSYFPPPQNLPPFHGPSGPGHFSTDFFGYPPTAAMGYAPAPQFGGPATGYMPPQNLPSFGMGMGAATPAWGPAPYPQTPNFGMMGVPGGYPPAPYPPMGPYTPAPPAQSHARPHDNRPSEQGADIDMQRKWFAGPHYGPVLDPFILRVVKARLDINPILKPPPEDMDNRNYLQWNMLFHSGRCRRRNDPAHVSWNTERNEPATRPRLLRLSIISQHFPWVIDVKAENPNIGVTCGEVIDTIDDFLHKITSKADYEALLPSKMKEVGIAYRYNRSPDEDGVPGGRLRPGLAGVDWLCKSTSFGGIVLDPEFVKKRLRMAKPDILVLRCCTTYPLTAEERREEQSWRQNEPEVRERRRRSPSRSRRGTPAPSVRPPLSTDSDSD